jgi:hypothetical protein
MRTSLFVLLAGLLGCSGTSSTTTPPDPAPGADAGTSADATTATDGGDPDAAADPCEGAFFEITLGGKTARLTGSCTENIPFERLQFPSGWRTLRHGDFLAVDFAACGEAGAHLGLELEPKDAPATHGSGFLTYTDAAGTGWSGMNQKVRTVVTNFGAEYHDRIEGTFQATLDDGAGAVRTATGSFSVCRVGP